MAIPVLFTFFLCLLLGLVSSKPVASNSADSVPKLTQLDNLASSKVESPVYSEEVKSLDSVAVPHLLNTVESFRRIKRDTIKGNGCSGDTIWFMKRCVSFKMYERILREEYGEK